MNLLKSLQERTTSKPGQQGGKTRPKGPAEGAGKKLGNFIEQAIKQVKSASLPSRRHR